MAARCVRSKMGKVAVRGGRRGAGWELSVFWGEEAPSNTHSLPLPSTSTPPTLPLLLVVVVLRASSYLDLDAGALQRLLQVLALGRRLRAPAANHNNTDNRAHIRPSVTRHVCTSCRSLHPQHALLDHPHPHQPWRQTPSSPPPSPDDTDLLDALEALGQEGEEVAAALDDVLGRAAQLDRLLLEHLRVERVAAPHDASTGCSAKLHTPAGYNVHTPPTYHHLPC